MSRIMESVITWIFTMLILFDSLFCLKREPLYLWQNNDEQLLNRSSCNISGDDTNRGDLSSERGYTGNSSYGRSSNDIPNNLNGTHNSVPNGESNGAANNESSNQSPSSSIGQSDSDYVEGDSVADDLVPVAPQSTVDHYNQLTGRTDITAGNIRVTGEGENERFYLPGFDGPSDTSSETRSESSEPNNSDSTSDLNNPIVNGHANGTNRLGNRSNDSDDPEGPDGPADGPTNGPSDGPINGSGSTNGMNPRIGQIPSREHITNLSDRVDPSNNFPNLSETGPFHLIDEVGNWAEQLGTSGLLDLFLYF